MPGAMLQLFLLAFVGVSASPAKEPHKPAALIATAAEMQALENTWDRMDPYERRELHEIQEKQLREHKDVTTLKDWVKKRPALLALGRQPMQGAYRNAWDDCGGMGASATQRMRTISAGIKGLPQCVGRLWRNGRERHATDA